MNWMPAKATALLLLAAAPLRAQEDMLDKNLPDYQKVDAELSGDLNAVGSDTMFNLMNLWGERFRKWYPGVHIQEEGKGSSTAPPALIQGAAQLGPMSRTMKSKEVDDFVKKFGYEPTRVRTCLDALAVFVNKDNPIQGLNLQQVDAIFGKLRKRGLSKDITRWGDLGLTGRWAQAPISLFGRNSASGTYGFFKEHVFRKGDYKDTVKEQPGSAAVVQGVTVDPYAIGYSGIGYRTSGVRAVPLAEDSSGKFFEADLTNVATGDYPLGRFLNLYINKRPGRPLDPVLREFLSFILSRQGQKIVVKAGYLPIPAKVVAQIRDEIGLPQLEKAGFQPSSYRK